MTEATPVLQLDKWLWFARFYKTRANATRAIASGRFRLDGEVMSKPHRAALPGQVLTFIQGERVRVVKIIALGTRRGPASEAITLYEDMSPPVAPRQGKGETASGFESRDSGAGRPTKRDRRATEQLKDTF